MLLFKTKSCLFLSRQIGDRVMVRQGNHQQFQHLLNWSQPDEQQASDGVLLVPRKYKAGLLEEGKILHILLFPPCEEPKQETTYVPFVTQSTTFFLLYPQSASANYPTNVNVCHQTATVSSTLVWHNQTQNWLHMKPSPLLGTGFVGLQIFLPNPLCLNWLVAALRVEAILPKPTAAAPWKETLI